MQPLWTRNKSDIKDEEYADFFRHQFYEWEKPMEVFHTKAEGTVEYTALLFIPGSAPMNLYYSDYEPGIQLYSRHVFIMDKIYFPNTCGLSRGLSILPTCPSIFRVKCCNKAVI